jgi:hypothetical protein
MDDPRLQATPLELEELWALIRARERLLQEEKERFRATNPNLRPESGGTTKKET